MPTAFSDMPPAYRGFLDAAMCSQLAGWGWDAATPGTTQTLDLWIDNRMVLTFFAGDFCPDLLAAGIGNGSHAFTVAVPPWLHDGQPHTIRVTFDGTPTDLQNSPHTLICAP